MRMQLRPIFAGAAAAAVLAAWPAWGQSNGIDLGPDQPPQGEGVPMGTYVVHQSIEAGYRFSENTGSDQMYDTLVNLHTGPRILSQTLSMQSTTHESTLFDHLYMSSFGWGGDPNNALRLRVDGKKWYTFQSSFRRDQNYFDYNLLANPLNPSTSSPAIPIPFSPHSFSTTRRMTDTDLTLLPFSRVSFRVGYSRNNMTGSSFNSLNNGAVALLDQPWNTTLNSYRFGVDYKPARQTVLSYDQFLDYYKGDTYWHLAPYISALVPGTSTGVGLGIPFNTVGGTPCAPLAGQPLIDSAGVLTNTVCNAYYSYRRDNVTRTSMPTERVSLHSNYFERLNLNMSYAYSSADMNAPLNEFFDGLVTRSETRQSIDTASTHVKRVSNVADADGTYHLANHWRLIETFRYWAYRIPQNTQTAATDWVVPVSSCALPTCSLLTPISSTVPISTASVGYMSFNQKWTRNQTDLVWDASKHFGARVGFRYDNRAFDEYDLVNNTLDHIPIHGYTPLAGVWANPSTALRFKFDWEQSHNDNSIVRIGARKESRYRFQSNYTPKPWALVSAAINVWDASNGDAFTDYRAHNRNYGLTTALMPNERFSFDVAFNYTDYAQNAFICFNDSDKSLDVVIAAGSCAANGYQDSKNPLLTYSAYTNSIYYGMTGLTFRPIHRLAARVGYAITSVNGNTPQFNALQPLGSVAYNYHQPLAHVSLDLARGVGIIGGWNYYQYGEDSFVGPTSPRYFHANNVTLGFRWGF